jgi:flagellar motility protein MotE (MotC chaperone)
MQELFNYPDVTGSVGATKPAEKPAEKPAAKPPDTKPPDAKAPATKPAAAAPAATAPAEPPRPVSAAERALLERLQARRQELDARARELDIRESLLKAAEQKLENRQVPAKDKDGDAKPDAPGPRKDDPEAGGFKSLVTMYETMKPKDAAKIFDRLDIKVLVEVSTQINPRRMSEILAQMTPDAAERLTVELANRARNPDKAPDPAELPKIDGKPLGG